MMLLLYTSLSCDLVRSLAVRDHGLLKNHVVVLIHLSHLLCSCNHNMVSLAGFQPIFAELTVAATFPESFNDLFGVGT